jgi:hypothetical protein
VTQAADPDLIAEASTPWGRVRVEVWTVRPLAALERAKLVARLGEVHTAIDPATPAPAVLEILRAAMAGPRVASVRAAVIVSDGARPARAATPVPL